MAFFGPFIHPSLGEEGSNRDTIIGLDFDGSGTQLDGHAAPARISNDTRHMELPIEYSILLLFFAAGY